MTKIAPPFTFETATARVRADEDAWSSRDPAKVAFACAEDSQWRSRAQFLQGRDEIREFLSSTWEQERECRLTKSLWSYTNNRIAVRFQYEYQDLAGQWLRAYGAELWEFDSEGLMSRRDASINYVAIDEWQRKFRWPTPEASPRNDLEIPNIK